MALHRRPGFDREIEVRRPWTVRPCHRLEWSVSDACFKNIQLQRERCQRHLKVVQLLSARIPRSHRAVPILRYWTPGHCRHAASRGQAKNRAKNPGQESGRCQRAGRRRPLSGRLPAPPRPGRFGGLEMRKAPQIAGRAYSDIACTRPQVLHAAAIEAAQPAHN